MRIPYLNTVYSADLIKLVFLFASFTANAQSDSLLLQEVTITSSIIPTGVSQTGRNILTISGDTFAKLPVNSVEELLRYVPGLEVQSRGPMGSQSDFVVRGGTFQQVLVILDGLRLNDPNSGHFTSYIPITPAQIDRIEVLKGASSALYGSDAVGGVIHIITKAFASITTKANSFGGQVIAGQFGLYNINGGGSYNTENTSIDAGILSNNASGQQQRGIKGFFHNTTLSAGLNQNLGRGWSAALRASYDSREFAAQNFYTTFVSDTANEKVTTSWNQVMIAHAGAKDRISLQAGYKEVNDTYQFNSVSAANQSKSKLLQSLAMYEYSFSKKTNVIAGLQLQQRNISSNDRGQHTINQQAIFLVLKQTIGEHLTISPTLRLDNDERSGTEFVPQLNVSFATGNLQLRASGGKTIRQADFTERYNNYDKTLVTSGRIGNPDLFAERSFSYEAGVDYWLPGKDVKFSGTIFQQKFNKLIDYVNTPYAEMPRQENISPSGTYALARNISDVTTSGAEVDISMRHTTGNGSALFSALGFIILDSSSPEGTPSLYLSSHARFMTNLTAGFSTPRYAFSITGLYKTRPEQIASTITTPISSSYIVLNVKVEYFVVRGKVSIFLQIDNIFDENYSDILGSIMPSRWVIGGVKVMF
ncbi:MAG: TonB-dependent receptor [Cyclobacteriaceae bacterium]|nr:TonB-dependent receptor [Cyclobacteriaceae bacterium]